MESKDKIFIAGNGPSLKDIKFSALRGVDWLGMNAAYRYWDEVGVYPSIYCCLDTVVVKSHSEEILRLICEGNIKHFFLVNSILEVIPNIADEGSVFFLEDLIEDASPGKEIFKTVFSDKKTTGSWAVRFAIFLGYRRIYLGGIDCNYVEVIDEAESSGVGLELKISSTVKKNPNYFFDSYQKPGDLYQIPNPERHFGNLHLQSFEALNADIMRLGLDVEIKNTALSSQLNRYGVYDYISPSSALNYPDLEAIAVPLTSSECDRFIINISMWDLPAFLPLRPNSPIFGKITLHLFFDCEFSQQIHDKITLVWEQLNFVNKAFRCLKISFLSIPEELNYYVRNKNITDKPRKMGPNVHFLAMLRECRKYRYTFLMETDCTPAKSNWLTDLNDYCCSSSRFWIAGSHPNDLDDLDPVLALHINGNSIYATGDEEFLKFLDDCFIPSLFYLVFEKKSESLAYDCLISKVFSYGMNARNRRNLKLNSDPQIMQAFEKMQYNFGKFRIIDQIKNISHVERGLSRKEILEWLDSGAVIVHSKLLNDFVSAAYHEFVGKYEIKLEKVLSDRFKNVFIKTLSPESIAFHYYSNLDGYTFERFDRTNCVNILKINLEEVFQDNNQDRGAYVVFTAPKVESGDYIGCWIRLTASTEQDLLIRFARDGNGRFSEDKVNVRLQANVQESVTLNFCCFDSYSRVRLFIKPTDGEPGYLKVEYQINNPDKKYNYRPIEYVEPSKGLVELYQAFKKGVPPGTIMSQKAVANGDKKELNFKKGQSKFLCYEKSLKYPRLLMVDSTPVGHGSATGQLKKMFLEAWPRECFLQIWQDGTKPTLHVFEMGDSINENRKNSLSHEQIIQKCQKFKPDLVYFRPVDSKLLFDIVFLILEKIKTPIVIHMMDDWPERLKLTDVFKYEKLDNALRRLLGKTSHRLSICQAMSDSYQQRYGGTWTPLANGVDLANFPVKDWAKRPSVSENAPFVIRYMGGLADDMTYSSVREIAAAVSILQSVYAVRFEIYTMDWYRSKADLDIGKLPGVEVYPLVEKKRYKQSLAEADALVIAYNFDLKSISYTGLSLANKMPECLATGVPLIGYGPLDVATIRYLKNAGCAHVVEQRDQDILIDSIKMFVGDLQLCQRLGEKGRAHVAKKLSKHLIQKKFKDYLSATAKIKDGVMLADVVGPFRRDQHAHYFEPVSLPAEGTLQPAAGIKRNGAVSLDQEAYAFAPPPGDNWIACTYLGHIAPGKSVSARVSFNLSTDCTLNIMLCRNGSTPFENASQKVIRTKGAHDLTLRHTFKHDHQGARIQIGVMDKPVTISNITSEMTFEPDSAITSSQVKTPPKSIPPELSAPVGILPTVIPAKPKVADNTLFIMGNGPSLRGLDFQRFNGYPTLGMNVAFRYWQRINWYPTCYICLDTVVTESQKDGICKLVQEQDKNGIRMFLLRRNLLKSYPKLKDNPSVLFFEDYLHSPAFEGVEPLSTGSHAALFGAMLGYKRICLLGIDCRYVQQIPEAQKVDGHVLEMTSTPGQNPNYFIDDYQQKGDRFNVPDSQPDLHYQSWVKAGARLEKLGVDLVNCNPQSRLDMFDFVDLKDILS